ncbi:hypothetical protein [Candidatus Endomicrobiellum cubanum]|jgi:hypothetical protein|uniref:hypothetical protein n=1 Tax=Candidatus Endomicrobiellum cubanum TaxID=3242325 RepID=UPI0035940DE3
MKDTIDKVTKMADFIILEISAYKATKDLNTLVYTPGSYTIDQSIIRVVKGKSGLD